MIKYVRPELRATIYSNIDLVLKHDVFLGYSNSLKDILDLSECMTFFGPDESRQFIIRYLRKGEGVVELQPSISPNPCSDEEPFYMNYMAVRLYLNSKEEKK